MISRLRNFVRPLWVVSVFALGSIATAQTLQLPDASRASPCFDPASLHKGAQSIAEYRHTSYVDGMSGVTPWRTTIRSIGPVEFEGRGTVWVLMREDIDNITARHRTLEYTYFDLDLTEGLFVVAKDVFSGPYRQRDVFSSAGRDRQLLLQSGQSHSFSFEVMSYPLDANGKKESLPAEVLAAKKPVADARKVTFVATEDITVPAGTFQAACKYNYGNGLTEWYASAGPRGILIKREDRPMEKARPLTSLELLRVSVTGR